MIRVGILGAAGYTGGELIRLLLNHPQAEIVFAYSESNAGNLLSDVHEGLIGETNMKFTSNMPFDDVDVLFFCFGHGKSEQFLKEHTIPTNVKIIDLAQDFRIQAHTQPLHIMNRSDVSQDLFIYGLPEINRETIRHTRCLANPGCFATCIQLGLLPAARMGILIDDVIVNGITGSTGAGQKPSATTHFSWRNNNISTYKMLTHQHLHEICQSLNQVRPNGSKPIGSPIDPVTDGVEIDFIPYRGDFARGIFVTSIIKTDADGAAVVAEFKNFYKDAAFTHYSEKPIDLKQVVNTNKCLVHVDCINGKVVITSAIDNLLKGAVGQAVQNMNLMFGIDETTGLRLKASAF